MPRPRIAEPAALAGGVGLRIGGHHVPPVLVVAIAHQQADGAPQGSSVPDAAQDLDSIGLDLHSPAATVAALASLQISVDRRPQDGCSGGETLDDDGQARSM